MELGGIVVNKTLVEGTMSVYTMSQLSIVKRRVHIAKEVSGYRRWWQFERKERIYKTFMFGAFLVKLRSLLPAVILYFRAQIQCSDTKTRICVTLMMKLCRFGLSQPKHTLAGYHAPNLSFASPVVDTIVDNHIRFSFRNPVRICMQGKHQFLHVSVVSRITNYHLSLIVEVSVKLADATYAYHYFGYLPIFRWNPSEILSKPPSHYYQLI